MKTDQTLLCTAILIWYTAVKKIEEPSRAQNCVHHMLLVIGVALPEPEIHSASDNRAC